MASMHVTHTWQFLPQDTCLAVSPSRLSVPFSHISLDALNSLGLQGFRLPEGTPHIMQRTSSAFKSWARHCLPVDLRKLPSQCAHLSSSTSNACLVHGNSARASKTVEGDVL